MHSTKYSNKFDSRKKKTLMSKSPRKMKTRKATVKVPEIEPHVIENEAIVKLASYSHCLLSEKHSLVGTHPPILGEKRSYYFECLE